MKRLTSFTLSALVLVGVLTGVSNTGCRQGGLTDAKTADGIVIRITTDKATYKLGEQVNIVVYVKNESSESFQYEYAVHKIHLWALSVNGDWVGIAEDGHKYNGEWAIATSGTLDAGESITLETFWDQRFFDGNGGQYVASPGNHTIKATFTGLEWLRRIDGLPGDTDSVTVNITIEE